MGQTPSRGVLGASLALVMNANGAARPFGFLRLPGLQDSHFHIERTSPNCVSMSPHEEGTSYQHGRWQMIISHLQREVMNGVSGSEVSAAHPRVHFCLSEVRCGDLTRSGQ